MNNCPFAISLNPDVQVTSTEDGYTLHGAESEQNGLLTWETTPGISVALDYLKAGQTTTASLIKALTDLDGKSAGEQFAVKLQQLDERGWLNYAVLPLAVAIPMVESAELNLSAPHWTQNRITLCRFAYQHSYKGTMVLESPLSKFRIKLLDWRASAILAQLAQPQTLATITPPPLLGPETAYQFLTLLWATGFLGTDPEPPSLQLWDFHNLLFHSRSRFGRHDYLAVDHDIEQWSDFPVVKPPMSDEIVPLPRPNLGALMYNDATLTEAIETRKSVRQYDDNHPISIEQLGELLYRTARVKELFGIEERLGKNWRKIFSFEADIDYGELSRRPYPGGGLMYELEIYPVVRLCEGLSQGIYHYDPLNHQLEQIKLTEDVTEDNFLALSGYDLIQKAPRDVIGLPQVILVVTARFGRLFRKYRSIGYSLVLKNVGVLLQNLYLVATNMGLAPSAWGCGDSDAFGQTVGLNYVEESAVGEFLLGSLPSHSVEASQVSLDGVVDPPSEGGSADLTNAEPVLTETEASEVEINSSQAQFESVGLTSSLHTMTTPAMSTEVLAQDTEVLTEVAVSEVEPVEPSESSPPTTEVTDSQVESSTAKMAIALHPHDLDDRIPGLAELHNQTLGDPRITIVILDGNPDHTLSCFAGANVSKVFPYWHEPADPISPEDYATFQAIRDQGLKGKAKQEALESAIPDTISRVELNDHACHVTSTIVGQEHSPVFGLAPNCRVINMPQDALVRGNYDDVVSPLNMARAFELAIELGANVIHCAFCRPTQTGEGEEILVKAIKKCIDNNILIVSPTGNNLGECWCLPAVISGTLAVGAAKVDGTPCHFSNWGGNNAEEGILAPGEDILGAQPCTEKPVRLTGTSMAAPVMTGISALLMSLQVQQGKPVDAEAVRTALLNTAIPCDPNVVEEPERCLRGFVNIPGAMKVLFGQPSVTISFAGDRVTRTEWAGYDTPVPSSITPAMTDSTSPSVTETAIAENTVADSAIASVQESAEPTNIETSTAFSGDVYALGTLGYDFGDEARRDTFKQLMPPFELDGIMVPPDPYDARQVVEHLDRNPDEARSLIWTLNLEQNTLYALEPKGPFASDVYEIFLQMLAGQLEPETSDEFVERISVAARRTNRTVELFSGEVVPVVTVHDLRGMYGWTVNALIDAALSSVRNLQPDQEPIVREAISAFLNRVYYDLHNLGQTSRDRALNFATTNIFQAVSVFAEAIASGRQLDTISVEKSPYCRIRSDCWDVLLTFFDPDSSRRSRRVFRFTLDVAANLPVTIGSIKRWSIPGQSNSQ
jgi:cyanobactin maturation PatA/PatG family protease